MILISTPSTKIILLLLASVGQAIWNPILPGFNPDPAIVRHDRDYFIACSSFEYYPGIPIYHSNDLGTWTLYSHAATRPEQLQLYGVPTTAGAWAPSLAYFEGKYWLSAMTRWTYDPVAKVWPRVWFISSTDMVHWSDPTWAEPWGIDPELFNDPVTGKTYLNLMAPNNNIDKIWGIYGCELSLQSGKCIGPYVSTWNGTLPGTTGRPEGPKTTYKDGYYYMIIAEGGTDEQHRVTVSRSKHPLGPYQAGPHNPLLFNGQWGFSNLTVQSTGHATLIETADGEWYASYLARRNVNGSSPLGRETFLAKVEWVDGWPSINHDGEPVLLSDQVPPVLEGQRQVPEPWVDDFSRPTLRPEWYQLRTPYTKNYEILNDGLFLHPNVFNLDDRDVPAALLKKQTSLNMSFSAELLGFKGELGPRNKVGISAYLSEFQHQDIGLGGCINATGMCLYAETRMNNTVDHWQTPLNSTEDIESGLTLHIRATPLAYQLGYTLQGEEKPTYVKEVSSKWQAFAPSDWLVFTGNMFALFATGEGQPWPYTAPTVGFARVKETYFEEDIADYDRW
ncbi:unnamed protein product [Clonostachys rosea]|uniref:Beta-xylosidase C-terminal Concanavalin A-like domain-containing protein n=1 Tax=Bionectria ochroleuca TaxID=29856 RepID=A0ABY6UYJ4_BIOOC|nr:unnamed protein product [Clonostachys rosea]